VAPASHPPLKLLGDILFTSGALIVDYIEGLFVLVSLSDPKRPPPRGKNDNTTTSF